MLTSVSTNVEGRVTSNDSGAAWLDDDSGLELSHNFSVTLCENGVGNKHIVVNALTDANLSGDLIGHGAKREWESRESLVHLDEECSRTFHLKVVDLLELSLEDSAASVVLLRDTFTGGDIDVKADDIAGLELP